MNTVVLCANSWQNVINAIPCLCCGILGLVALYLLLKYVVQPCMTSCHEREVKEDAFEREKIWANFNTTKASTDEALMNQVKELNEKKSELESTLNAEKHNKELLEKQLKLYDDVFEKLNIEIKPKEKQ